MPDTPHTVEPGECISSLGFENGLHPDTIWNHSANGSLRQKRKDGHVLMEGDILVIPERRLRSYDGATDKRYRFRRLGVPEILNLQFLSDGKPRKNLKYVLKIEGRQTSGTTDAEGRIRAPLPPAARKGLLILDECEEYELVLGELHPVTTAEGIVERLRELAFLEGDGSDPRELGKAVERFQLFHKLPITGETDETTLDKLREHHVC